MPQGFGAHSRVPSPCYRFTLRRVRFPGAYVRLTACVPGDVPSTGGRLRDLAVAALVRDMVLMTRADSHVPDRVAALLMCRWACDQSERGRAEWFEFDTFRR